MTKRPVRVEQLQLELTSSIASSNLVTLHSSQLPVAPEGELVMILRRTDPDRWPILVKNLLKAASTFDVDLHISLFYFLFSDASMNNEEVVASAPRITITMPPGALEDVLPGVLDNFRDAWGAAVTATLRSPLTVHREQNQVHAEPIKVQSTIMPMQPLGPEARKMIERRVSTRNPQVDAEASGDQVRNLDRPIRPITPGTVGVDTGVPDVSTGVIRGV
jgi:hypothetical protein